MAFANENETKTFIATAYYSPLPNQENYYRWSYEADKKLNGEWERASDGTPVFVGMIAAPKNYSFGTKIELEWLGVVSVHDRGGAISAKNGYDRIDIWMGYGDEWLKRTIAWWKRELIGKIVDSSTPTSLQLENILEKAPKPLDIALKKLQAIGYNTQNTSTKEIITQFQLDHGIISHRNEDGAGTYGPKTTSKLAQIFNEKQKNNTLKQTAEIKQNKPLEELAIFEVTNNNNNESVKIWEKIDEITARKMSQQMQVVPLGEQADTMKNLQSFLKKIWYYTDEIHGTMTLQTLKSLKKYQFDNNLPQTGRTDIATQQFIRRDLMK